MVRTIALMMLALLVASPAAAAPSAAAEQTFGDWRSVTLPGFWSVYTTNESGSQLGFMCTKDLCDYYVDLGRPCVANQTYYVAVSAQAEGGAFSLICMRSGTGPPMLFFTPPAVGERRRDALELDGAIGADVIGIAVAIDSGFNVERFSGAGARDAVGWVRNQAANATAAPK